MTKEAVFTLKLEVDLRDAFMNEAAASHRPASQIVRDFMRDFVKKEREQRAYQAWFIADTEKAVREADDPDTVWVPHEQVMADMERQRQSLLARIAKRDAGEEAATTNPAE